MKVIKSATGVKLVFEREEPHRVKKILNCLYGAGHGYMVMNWIYAVGNAYADTDSVHMKGCNSGR